MKSQKSCEIHVPLLKMVVFLLSVVNCSCTHSDVITVQICSLLDVCHNSNLTQAIEMLSSSVSSMKNIYLEPGEHNLHASTNRISHVIGNLSGISLIGKSTDPLQVVIRCDSGVGLAFYEASNLIISNLTISNCGLSSRDTSFGGLCSGVTAALHIANSENVVMRNVVVRNTNGIGLHGINLRGLLEHVHFENNSQTTSDGSTDTCHSGGAVLIFQDNNKQAGIHSLEIVDCLFISNQDDSIFKSSGLYTQDFVTNVSGGGLKVFVAQVSYDVCFVLRNSTFRNNKATFGAGALIGVITDGLNINKSNAFRHSGTVDVSIQDCYFIGNIVQYGASALLLFGPVTFGHDSFEISSCTFINNTASSVSFPVLSSSPLTGTTLSVQFLNLLLTGTNKFFQNTGTAFEAIDSTVYIDGQVNVYNDTEISILVNPVNLTVMPGQRLELQVSTVDKFKQPVPSFLTLRVLSGDSQATIDNGVAWLASGVGIISFAVSATPNKTVSISLSAFDKQCSGFSAQTNIDVDITPCRDFLYFSEATHSCACDQQLANIGIYCNAKSDSILIPNGQWFGPVMTDEGNETVLGYSHCLQDYCEPNSVNVSNQDYDFQCSEELHRSGIACGSCEHGLSATLGSSQCQQCSNVSLFLILLFAFTGIITIVGIVALKISIADGYLNSVLFYSNFVNLFAVYFTSPTTGKGAFFLTAWISQNFGVPACFYDGMTALVVNGLHLAYIAYLFVLCGMLGLVTRCTRTRLQFAKNHVPSKVFASILVMCYASVLETCVKVFFFTRVSTLNGETLTRWYYDPSVVYFRGTHAFLCVLAILVLIVYIIPLPFLVISPKITKIKQINKLQTFLNTFWAPFKSNFQWWLSFRLLLRLVPIFVSSFVPTPYNVLSMDMLLMILLFTQSHLQPFRGFWQNILDDTLALNLILAFSGYFFFAQLGHTQNGLVVYSAVFAVLIYLLFMIVSVIHFSLLFPKCKAFLVSLPLRFNQSQGINRLNIPEDNIDENAGYLDDTYSDEFVSQQEKEQNLDKEENSIKSYTEESHFSSEQEPILAGVHNDL